METSSNSSVENMSYVVKIADSPVKIENSGQKGVKELARMFSARSKDKCYTTNNFAKKASPNSSPLRSKHQNITSIAKSKTLDNDEPESPNYENIFDDPNFIVRHKKIDPQMPKKKPIPTPRKTSTKDATYQDESSDEDGYTPMSATIDELHELKKEIVLSTENTSKTSLSQANVNKQSSQNFAGNIKGNFLPTKRVLDAGQNAGNRVALAFSNEESSSDEDQEYYLPILPNGVNLRHDEVIHRKIPTERSKNTATVKKRTQGSMFAEELIDIISNDDYYHQIPKSKSKRTVRDSTHSYMEISEKRLRSLSTRMLLDDDDDESEPVYVQAEEGCDEVYVCPVDFSVSTKSSIIMSRDTKLKSQLTPPNLFPKSESLIREQEMCFNSVPKEVTTEHTTKSKKQGNIVKALKNQTFGKNKKKKVITHVISSPKLPLYPPQTKKAILEKHHSLSDSDLPVAINNTCSTDKSSKSPVSFSFSLSPTTPTQTPFDVSPNLLQSPNNYSELEQHSIHKSCSDTDIKDLSSQHNICSSTDSSDERENITPTMDNGTARDKRLNTCTTQIKTNEDSILLHHSNTTSKRVFGYFTSQGGKLTGRETNVEVHIPVDAIPKGMRQKIWFEVLQTMCKEGSEAILESVCFNKEFDQSNQSSKKDNAVQLSLTVLVGPSDIVLNKPIKVFVPHCITVDNTVWNIKVIGRVSQSDDWEQLVPSGNRFITRNLPKQKKYKNSTFKVYSDCFRVKTRHVGCFRMTGKPVGQTVATKITKKMVSSVYCQKTEGKDVRVKVFVTNAFLDSIETLYHMMVAEGYTCIERNTPFLCFGDRNDLRVSLLIETNEGKVATCTQVIPFEKFWRVTRIGEAVATFDMSGDEMVNSKVMRIELYQKDESQQTFEVLLPYTESYVTPHYIF